MQRYLIHWYYLSRATVYLTIVYFSAALRFRKYTANESALPQGQEFTHKAFGRWRQYYYGTTFLSAVFCLLYGHRRNRLERRLFAKLAALACYFDDLTDVYPATGINSDIKQIDIETYGRAADPQGRALGILKDICDLLPAGQLHTFKKNLQRVFEVESADRQKSDRRLTPAKLEEITAEKGRYSVLLFRSLLEPELLPGEQLALGAFGHLIQLCDDIFDLWFDRKAGIHTLATEYAGQGRMDMLDNKFERVAALAVRDFRSSGCPRNNIETTLRAIHFLTGITRACLKHYRDLQRIANSLPLDDRASMVVDMARWSNRWQAAREILKPFP